MSPRLPSVSKLTDRPDGAGRSEGGGARRPARLQDARVAVLGAIDRMTYSVVAGIGAAGLHVEVLSPNEPTVLDQSRYCRASHVVPAPVLGRFPDEMVERVRAVLVTSRIDVIVAADFHALVWLADHGADLAPVVAFPVPTRAQIERCNDKWQLMGLCASLGLDHPASGLVETADDVGHYATWGRIVVKPLSEGYGYGVYELASGAELAEHVRREDRPGNALPLLVQEYVPGEDIDVTLLVDHGRTVTGVVQQRLADGRSFRYSGDPMLLAPVEVIAEAVGFHGVMDFDLRRDPASGRVVVIECNPRFPGSLINKTWAGVNMALDGVALALGFPITRSDVRWPATYHPPRLRHAHLVARPAFWRGGLVPTRVGWTARASDPRYTATMARAEVTRRLRR